MDRQEERSSQDSIAALDIALERDGFMRTLVRHLAGALEDVVGLEQAEGFISLVGQQMGAEIGALYLGSLQQTQLRADQVSSVLIDLKRRITGDFFVIEENEDRIVFGNNRCPFGRDKVEGRPAMCMMTSNVFGSIAAETTGYAKVDLQQTIAQGHEGCRIVVHLKISEESQAATGREYFGE